MTTNGHPFPAKPLEPRPRPEPVRRLCVEIVDGDCVLETVEPTDVDCGRWLFDNSVPYGKAALSALTDDELTAECVRRGLHVEPTYTAAELGIGEPAKTVPELTRILRKSQEDARVESRQAVYQPTAPVGAPIGTPPPKPLRTRLAELTRERQKLDDMSNVCERHVTEAEFDALVDALQERLP